MKITRFFKCNDFDVRWYYGKYPPTNEKRCLYKVVYLGEDGKSKEEIADGFFRKSDARNHIRMLVKKANFALRKSGKLR